MTGQFGVVAPLGTIVSGTMRLEDRIPACVNFLDSLKERLGTNPAAKETFAAIDNFLAELELKSQDPDYYESEEASWDLEAICETIEDFLPPYTYIGGLHGDPADFGVWADHDSIDFARAIGELEFGDGLPNESTESGYFLHISDHGNMELYEWREGKWHSVWGVV